MDKLASHVGESNILFVWFDFDSVARFAGLEAGDDVFSDGVCAFLKFYTVLPSKVNGTPMVLSKASIFSLSSFERSVLTWP